MNFKIYLIVLIGLVLNSCELNRAFLRAVPISPSHVEGNMRDWANDSTIHYKIGNNYQPTFYNLKGDTLKKDYKIEGVVFKSQTGSNLSGWLLLPKRKYNGTTLLFLHGKGGNLFNQYQRLVPLVLLGFKVMVFDYSGFGYSTGKAKRSHLIEDANAALDYLISRKDLGTQKLFIYGQSLGGHLAVITAALNQEKIDGLIIEGAFSNHKDIAVKSSGLGILARVFTKEMYSASDYIKQYKKPLLVIHSVDDRVVPISMGKKLFNLANEPKSFMEIDKCHVCGPFYYDKEIKERILQLLP